MRVAFVAVLTLIGLLIVAPSAQAETWTGADAVGDVTSYYSSPKPPPCGTSAVFAEPDDAEHDITSLTVDHRADAVEVDLGIRDLSRTGTVIVTVHLRTKGHRYQVVLSRIRGETLTFFSTESPPPAPDDVDECGGYYVVSVGLPCEGLTTDLDDVADVARVVLPGNCLRGTAWVRAGADVVAFKRNASFYDIWGHRGLSGTYPGPYGPKVRVS